MAAKMMSSPARKRAGGCARSFRCPEGIPQMHQNGEQHKIKLYSAYNFCRYKILHLAAGLLLRGNFLKAQLLADGASGAQNMLRQSPGSRLGIASLECLEDLPVLAHRIVPACPGRQCKKAGALGTRQQRVMGRLQDAGLGAGNDEAVYFLIDLEILFQFAAVVVRLHALLELGQSLEFLICDPRGCELRRNSLDGA